MGCLSPRGVDFCLLSVDLRAQPSPFATFAPTGRHARLTARAQFGSLLLSRADVIARGDPSVWSSARGLAVRIWRSYGKFLVRAERLHHQTASSTLWVCSMPTYVQRRRKCVTLPHLREQSLGTLRRRTSVGVVFALGSMFVSHFASAHFVLQAPPSWMSQDSTGSPQKMGPCGDEGGGTPSNIVTAFAPGQTITVTIKEAVFHPGHYRIALSTNSRSELPAEPAVTVASTPCGSAAVESPAVFPVLADGILDHSAAFSGPQSVQVTLPSNVTCTKCTLQVIEFMSDHPLNNPGGCFYHHCADISIQSTGTGGSGAGGGSTMGTGGTKMGTGGTTIRANGGTSSVGTGGSANGGSGGTSARSTGGTTMIATGGAVSDRSGGTSARSTGGATLIATGGAVSDGSGGASTKTSGGTTAIEIGGSANVGSTGTSSSSGAGNLGGTAPTHTGGTSNAGSGGAATSASLPNVTGGQSVGSSSGDNSQSGGCSCSTPGTKGKTPWLPFAVGLPLVIFRRRRRAA